MFGDDVYMLHLQAPTFSNRLDSAAQDDGGGVLWPSQPAAVPTSRFARFTAVVFLAGKSTAGPEQTKRLL